MVTISNTDEKQIAISKLESVLDMVRKGDVVSLSLDGEMDSELAPDEEGYLVPVTTHKTLYLEINIASGVEHEI